MTILEASIIRMPFGKRTGQTLAEIARDEPDYLAHIATFQNLDFHLTEAIRLVAEKSGIALPTPDPNQIDLAL